MKKTKRIIYITIGTVLLTVVIFCIIFFTPKRINVKSKDVSQVYIYLYAELPKKVIELKKEKYDIFFEGLSKIKLKCHFGDVKGKSDIVIEIKFNDGTKNYYDGYRLTKVDKHGNKKIINIMCLETEWVNFISNFIFE